MTHHPLDHPEPHPHATPHPHGVGHIVSPKILIATAVALLILTVVTVAVAEIDFAQMDLPELNIFIALLVASLVCLFFMHLKWDRPFNSLVLVASLAGVALFIAFALTDTSEYQHEVIYGESNLIRSRIPTPDQLAAPAAPPAAPQGDAAGATAP
jgi:cytochrome c oxidase subunit IV